jgi:hypothetical protein
VAQSGVAFATRGRKLNRAGEPMATQKQSIETILKDPAKHFASPHDVVTASGYSRDEKRRILDSWAVDAQLLTVAEEENMGGDDRPGLREVKLALLELENS